MREMRAELEGQLFAMRFHMVLTWPMSKINRICVANRERNCYNFGT